MRPWLPKQAVDLAIDLHLIPYAGITNLTSRLLRSQAKQGTNRFHGYSTAYIAYEDHRFSIGCRWVLTRRHLVRVIEKHLKEAEAHVGKAMWDYNHVRPHSRLKYRAPSDYAKEVMASVSKIEAEAVP